MITNEQMGNDQITLSEMLRGITNFVLSVLLVLTFAEGGFILPLFCAFGLIMTNSVLLKDKLIENKNISHTLYRLWPPKECGLD